MMNGVLIGLSWQDLVNSGFEALAGVFVLNQSRALWKSRQAYGVSLLSVLFFNTFGFWNLYYYPHLNQWSSFFGGFCVTLANTVWVTSIVWLRRAQIKHVAKCLRVGLGNAPGYGTHPGTPIMAVMLGLSFLPGLGWKWAVVWAVGLGPFYLWSSYERGRDAARSASAMA
jgi:hypothetical protein